MAQKIYTEHGVPLESFEKIQELLGILEPGVYRGFDEGEFSGNTLTITHELTGASKTNKVGNATRGNLAILLSKQGSIIEEDAPVEVSIDYNVGNSEERIDLLIGTHFYQDAEDSGLDMVFSIVKGPLNDPSEPELPDPLNDIIIGKVYIPAEAASHAETTYQRALRPGLANRDLQLQSETESIKLLEITPGLVDVSLNSVNLTNEEFSTNYGNDLGNVREIGLYHFPTINLSVGPIAGFPSVVASTGNFTGFLLVSKGSDNRIIQFLVVSEFGPSDYGPMFTRIYDPNSLPSPTWGNWVNSLGASAAKVQLIENDVNTLLPLLDEEKVTVALQTTISVLPGWISSASVDSGSAPTAIKIKKKGKWVRWDLGVLVDIVASTASTGVGVIRLTPTPESAEAWADLVRPSEQEATYVTFRCRESDVGGSITKGPAFALVYWQPDFVNGIDINIPYNLIGSSGIYQLQIHGGFTFPLLDEPE